MNKFKLYRVFEADKGTSSGTTDQTSTETEKTGDQPAGKTFTEAELNNIVKERLDREARRNAEKAQKDREAAEAAKLAEQQEFKQLADNATAKLSTVEADLAATKEKAERYETALTAYLATLRKTVPAHLIGLLDKLDPVDQIDWIAANGDKLNAQPVAGVPGTPKQKGSQTEADREAAQAAQSGFYKGKF